MPGRYEQVGSWAVIPVGLAYLNETWKREAEQVIISTINEQGLLEHGGNKADMACLFHFLRTKFGGMGLSVSNIYSLDRAQNAICSLLTTPWIISEEDRYLDPPDRDYLEINIGKQYAGSIQTCASSKAERFSIPEDCSSVGNTNPRSTAPGMGFRLLIPCSSITVTPIRIAHLHFL